MFVGSAVVGVREGQFVVTIDGSEVGFHVVGITEGWYDAFNGVIVKS